MKHNSALILLLLNIFLNKNTKEPWTLKYVINLAYGHTGIESRRGKLKCLHHLCTALTKSLNELETDFDSNNQEM